MNPKLKFSSMLFCLKRIKGKINETSAPNPNSHKTHHHQHKQYSPSINKFTYPTTTPGSSTGTYRGDFVRSAARSESFHYFAADAKNDRQQRSNKTCAKGATDTDKTKQRQRERNSSGARQKERCPN